jgi:hypothetical protein
MSSEEAERMLDALMQGLPLVGVAAAVMLLGAALDVLKRRR